MEGRLAVSDGEVKRQDGDPLQRALDRALPQWHFRECHGLHVSAPPERALAAALEVPAADMPVVRALFQLRGLHPDQNGTLLDAMRKDGFQLLEDDVYVAIGRPWTRGGGLRSADFRSFAEPGFAKIAMDFRATPERDGCRLETETRVLLTDATSRRRFAAYWLFIRPFSGLVRRSWLAAARRRAEGDPSKVVR